ncbi:hypothetical protein [Sinorhizobium meliloti]|uniref:hypothetical protein n=1 Tax=Rhizobium meliloti TaxID=382 RepID=UPI000362BF01|nr:hypothetical protein [Sinorhizobium meliloti]MDX0289471.1 hypothetical protein [Sinorhizobium meliloti]RVG15021.1 hypothetical protein CN234_03235 [Sinorhizobium meliloti]RVG54080.1 hypothetical protein CN226_10260 [Sinorhizobium meliloti]RVL94682.1 hypothetical protein CN136_21435 [Sinorhizobium meliloti]RVM28803.1 hypothetical protein CN130_21965 [Sinorhizobium meliloti]
MSRWIRVQTSIFDHEVFAAEPFSEREAWLWLISKAAWKDTVHRIGASVMPVPAGSLFVTIREMQAAWKWTSTRRVHQFLELLSSQNMIETCSETGKTLVTVCNYSKYQNAETHSETLEGAEAKQKRNTKDTSTPDTNTSSLRSDVCPEPEKSAPASPTVIELPTVNGDLVPIKQADMVEWSEAFPAVNVRQQLAAMRSWLNANPKNRKTSKGMKRFVVSWLSREQDRGAPRQQSPPVQQKTAFQLHQEAFAKELDKTINGNDRYDDRPDNVVDLAATDYRYSGTPSPVRR